MSAGCIIVSQANVGRASRIIQDLVAEILVDIGALYKASEAVCDSCLLLKSATGHYPGGIGGHVMVFRPRFHQ